MKNNLPVILLKDLVLLPNNDIKLEFSNDESRKIIDMAEMFHNNELLVVTQVNPYEENPDLSGLPKIGVISKITHKMVLPNGQIRVIISGLKRCSVSKYLNPSNILEAIINEIEKEQIEPLEQTAILRKVKNELDYYIRVIPYMGNSIMSKLSKVTDLDIYTDILAPSLPISFDRLNSYLNESKASERARMILIDIYKEQELYNIEKDIDLKVKKELDDTQKDFILREKIKKIREELNEVSSKDEEIEKLRNKLVTLDISKKLRNRITKEINRYENMNDSSPEISIVRNYIDWMLDLPWNIETIDNDNLKDVKKKLDASHAGLDDIKTRIIEYLAIKKMTNSLRSPIICLVGPPGVGKTSLSHSIAGAINRNFVKISVGGLSDECEIMGHRRTYIGSAPGRIISSIKKAKSCNPVFLIDEIDKMMHDAKGDPTSALLSVLDPEQNKYFSDNYIEEEFDLSKVMFIATANNIENIPLPLRDRLEIINISGYTEDEKVDIAKKYLIPKICQENGLDKNIKFKEDALLLIIRNYTKEAGIRELERLISTIVRKVVTSIVENNIKVSSLFITTKNLESYLGKIKYSDIKLESKIGVINGLAYTSYGGEVLPIETTYYKGKGNLLLTGSLGEVIKESATIALSYLKANYDKFNIDYSLLENNDIHIHALEGAVPKDGPSAGIALTTSLISSLTNLEVSSSIALTGEISLHGKVLKIGGLKEKVLGAYRYNVRNIFFPRENICDLDDIPSEVRDKMNFIPVDNYQEVYDYIINYKEMV